MRTIKTCTVGLASLLITGFGVSAPAADKGDEFADVDSMMLEEIVVTARRREESAQTVPVSITAITAEDLKNRSAIVLSDIAKETPSLTIQSRQGDQNTQIVQLRGQVQTDAAATLDPSVGVYLNDIYVSRNNGANFELFDVDRVEVLSGPQGTLYGRNTTGGAIKLITTPADLKGKMNGYAAVNAGNFNGRRVEGAVNIPVADNFAVRVAGLDTTRDGYGRIKIGSYANNPQDGSNPLIITKTVDTDDKDTKAGRISAMYEPMEKLTLSMVSDYSKQVTNGNTAYDLGATSLVSPPANPLLKPYGNSTKCSSDFYTGCANFTPKSDVKTYGTALTAAYDTGIGTAKVIYGYRTADGFYKSDLEGSPLSLENLTVPTKTHQNTLETQLQGQTDKLDYTLGLFYFKEVGQEQFNDFGALTQGTRTFKADVDNDSTSIYGQTGYSLTKTVRLTTGLRYTEDKKGIENHALLQPGTSNFPQFAAGLCLFTNSDPTQTGLGAGLLRGPTSDNCKFDRSDKFHHLSWTVGLDWQPRDGILTYIKASDGYRSGGQNVRGIDALTSKPFGEESIRDIELGLKSRLADRVRLNLTAYHSLYSDIQTTVFLIFPFPQNTTTYVVNQGTAKINGLEAQSIILATDNLSFDLTGSYTDVNYARPDVVPQLSPKYKASIGANLFFPLSFGDWNARLSYAYQGKYNDGNSQAIADTFPQTVSNGRGLLDGRLGLTFKEYNLNVALYGTNLTNKQYPEVVTPFIAPNSFNGTVVDPTAGALIDVFNRVQVGAPRMFGLELNKKF